MIIASRDASRPLDVRRGDGSVEGATSACTSATSGRRPSRVTVTHVPGTAWSRVDRNSPLGSARPVMPASDRSKQPTSSVGPKRFLTARTRRSRECRSPSNWMTTSTRCSSTRGPAIEPSLVTCPTRRTAMPRALAAAMRRTGDLAHLGDVACLALDVGARDGLHGVDDEQPRRARLDVAEHGREVGLGGEVERVGHRRDAFGAGAHLRGGLLAADVEDLGARPGRPGGDVEQQRRLADARLAGDEDHATGHETATEDAVELRDARSVVRPPASGRRRRCAGPG